jgi:3-hydroxyisobutyrate dehydrogenase
MSNDSAIVPPAPVAVVGLGNMGVPMGACLIRAVAAARRRTSTT